MQLTLATLSLKPRYFSSHAHATRPKRLNNTQKSVIASSPVATLHLPSITFASQTQAHTPDLSLTFYPPQALSKIPPGEDLTTIQSLMEWFEGPFSKAFPKCLSIEALRQHQVTMAVCHNSEFPVKALSNTAQAIMDQIDSQSESIFGPLSPSTTHPKLLPALMLVFPNVQDTDSAGAVMYQLKHIATERGYPRRGILSQGFYDRHDHRVIQGIPVPVFVMRFMTAQDKGLATMVLKATKHPASHPDNLANLYKHFFGATSLDS